MKDLLRSLLLSCALNGALGRLSSLPMDSKLLRPLTNSPSLEHISEITAVPEVVPEAITDPSHITVFQYGLWDSKIPLQRPKTKLSKSFASKARDKIVSIFSLDQGYRAYYNLASQITSENEGVRVFASAISSLGPKIPSQGSVSLQVTDSIKIGMKALQQNNLSTRERIWILGTLSYLEGSLNSQLSKTLVREIEPGVSVSRGEIELALTRGKIKSQEVRGLWSVGHKTEEDKIDRGVREALQRAEILRNMHKEFQGTKIGSVTEDFQKIHDSLLTTSSFTNKETIEYSFMARIQRIVTSPKVSQQEKIQTDIISNHLFKFNRDFKTKMTGLMENNVIFEKNFYKIKAQQTYEEIINDSTLSKPTRKLLQGFKDIENLDYKTVVPAVEAFLSNELELEERVKIYRVINSASTFIDAVSITWKQKIESFDSSPLSLSLIWEKMYPGLEPDVKNILDFEQQVFLEHPGLLDSARRTVIAQRMHSQSRLASDSPYISEFASLPWKYFNEPQANDVYKNLLKQMELYSQHSEEDPLNANGQMLRFEALLQLIAYSDGYRGEFIRALSDNRSLHKTLHAFYDGFNNFQKSGIVPHYLEEWRERLHDILWMSQVAQIPS